MNKQTQAPHLNAAGMQRLIETLLAYCAPAQEAGPEAFTQIVADYAISLERQYESEGYACLVVSSRDTACGYPLVMSFNKLNFKG